MHHQKREDGVGAGVESDAGGALLHGLHRVLCLEEPSMGAERRHVGVVLVPEHSGSFYRWCRTLLFFPHDLGISGLWATSLVWEDLGLQEERRSRGGV
jgi:hypothetical protein